MLDDLRALAFFAKTVEFGSFKECATHFNVSPSIVSQHISQLETKYGVTLLYRSTRKLTLTPEGRDFHQKSEHMVHAAEEALLLLTQQSAEPTGMLRINMPSGLIKSHIMTRLCTFMKTYPKIKMDISFSDKRIDLIEQQTDLAIRVGDMKDSSLMTRKIANLDRKLVCTPDYAARHPIPQNGSDLMKWDWIKMKMMPPYRKLFDPTGQEHLITFDADIEVDNVEAMTTLSRNGLGLATPPICLVTDDLKRGNLVEILPSWKVSDMEVYAIWPQNNVRRKLTSLLLEEAFS